MGLDSSVDSYLMEDSIISDFVEDEGQRLMFVFDYMTDRAFFMELKKSEPGKTLQDPVCSLSMGQAPAQFVDMDDFVADIDRKAAAGDIDLDDDLYGSDAYNDDELDLDGFTDVNYPDDL